MDPAVPSCDFKYQILFFPVFFTPELWKQIPGWGQPGIPGCAFGLPTPSPGLRKGQPREDSSCPRGREGIPTAPSAFSPSQSIFALPRGHFPLPHCGLCVVSSEGWMWGMCPSHSSEFLTVYPAPHSLSWKGQWHWELLVAPGGEAVPLSVIICSPLRSNNPPVQAFLRSLMSTRRGWKVGDTGK